MARRPGSRTSIPLVLVAALVVALPGEAHAVQGTSLREGQTVTGSLAAGDTAHYTVQVGADSFVYGEVDQRTVDVRVRITDADGRAVRGADGLGRGGERFAAVLEDAGTYGIELIAAEDEAGDYALVLHRVEALETDPSKLADQLLSPWEGDVPGAAVRVWRDGRTLYSRAVGMANLAYGIPFRTDTRTNIGSTTKQFTAFAVMLEASRGALSLDDDIRTHIPELPAFDDTIRVRHLITHTSGLREFLNLLSMQGRRLDHGDWIDRSELIDIVQRQPALQNVPGAEWNYNNTAFGLAALIVERTSGKDFDVYMRENVFDPLGMDRTVVRASRERIVAERSEGYTPGHDGYLEIGDLGGAVGAGGIYSTVEDLQVWVENYASPRVGSAEIFEEMMTSFVLNDGEETNYGYGLALGEQRGLRRVQHGGADVAHRSMLMYFPEIRAGLTTQSNDANFDSGLAARLAEAFFADAMEPEEEPGEAVAGDFDPADYDPEAFDELAGRYALDSAPSFVLSFTREGSTFYTQATGQPRLEIVPTSDSTFALTAVQASLTFHRNEDGAVDGLTLHQNGDQHATRLPDDGAEAWAPEEGDLQAFVGRYFSEELETFYEVALEEGALVVHHRRMDDIELDPGDEPDTFSGSPFSFSFERDRNGQVIGFYVDFVRTRDVRFQRVP